MKNLFETNKNKLTPMMVQYVQIKEVYKDMLLLYRMGDFYEMFFEDAIIGSEILGIALTQRGKIQDEKNTYVWSSISFSRHLFNKIN